MAVEGTPAAGGSPPLPLLLAGVALGYAPCLSCLPLMRAEAMYALIPLAMAGSGDWLTPVLHGVPYLDKPPLLYWLNALIFWGLGARQATDRLINLGLALGGVWLTYRLGCRLLSPRVGWLGAAALAGSLGFFLLHLQLLPDHLITFWLLAALCLWLAWLERPGMGPEAGFFVCLAGGFLSKGLIGLGFPLAIVCLTALAGHRRDGLTLLRSCRGWLLAAGLTVPWLAAMELQHPGFWWHHFVNEQILRFLGERQPPDINPFSLGAFWFFLGLWLLPWTPLALAGVVCFWREEAGPAGLRPQSRLLLVWAGVVLIFFSLSSCRVEYYLLPALPPLALLVGWRLERAIRRPGDRALPLTLLFLALSTLIPWLFLPHLQDLLAANRREFLGLGEALAPLLPPALLTLAALGLTGGVAGWRRPRLAAAFLAGWALSLMVFGFLATLGLSPYLSDKLPGEWLKAHAGPGDVVVMETVEEYEYAASLAFYCQRGVLVVARGGLPRLPWPVAPKESFLISPSRLEELWQGQKRVFVLVDESTPPADPWRGGQPVFSSPGKRLYANK